jgi:hypothetical protein
VLVAGCAGGAFNGIGARNVTLQKAGNEKYLAEGKKVCMIVITLTNAALINRLVLSHLRSWLLLCHHSNQTEYQLDVD